MKKPAPVSGTKPVREKIEGPFEDAGQLPSRVAAMREKILEACATGDIEQLRPAIERNEVMPLFGKAGDRPRNFASAIEFLRQRAFDGKGRETLLVLQAVLNAPFAKITRGPHVTYVWPAFSVITPAVADPELLLAMAACVTFADFASSKPGEKMPLNRAEIGEDGTWHAFGIS